MNNFADFLRKFVLPIMTVASTCAFAYSTFVFANISRWDGAAIAALLAGTFGYFSLLVIKPLFSSK